MKYFYVKIIVIFSILSVTFNAFGQDQHFSQYYATPHLVSPVYTHLFYGDTRYLINYKDQWQAVSNKPYTTISASVDFKRPFRKYACDYVGMGVHILADKAGSLNFSTTNITGNFSYYKALNSYGSHYLALGVAPTIGFRGLRYDPNTAFLETPEIIPNTNFTYLDLSVGGLWYKNFKGKSALYLGAALFHLNGAEQSHFANSVNFSATVESLYTRKVVHGGGHLKLSKQLALQPSFFAQWQGTYSEVNYGGFLRYTMLGHVTNKNPTDFYIGVFNRVNDAYSVALRLDIHGYQFTTSYDINQSGFTVATQGKGGLECSLTKILFNKKLAYCPQNMNCPFR